MTGGMLVNILVIENDQKIQTKVVDSLKEIFNDDNVKIATCADLLAGMGMMLATGVGKFDFIICAETVEETGGGGPSNGLKAMKQFRKDGLCTPIVILSDKKTSHSVIDGIYFIHRNTKVWEARLQLAADYFFKTRH